MPNPKGNLILSENDRAILTFLWRWKLATTRNLALRFFRQKSFRAAYIRLWRLEQAGYIQSTSTSDRKSHLWILSNGGFQRFVAPNINLKQVGYKSEYIDHDFFVNAVHLGDWVSGLPEDVDVFSEQELRRFAPDKYPAWVPKSQFHRPDGYSLVRIGSAPHLLAIEVELSQKSLRIYEGYGRFYAEDAFVNEVIWVVPNRPMADKLLRRIKSAVSKRGDIHSFFLKKDVQIASWNARSIIGKSAGKQLCEVYGISPEKALNNVSSVQFFDTRKSLVESGKSKLLAQKTSPSIKVDIVNNETC